MCYKLIISGSRPAKTYPLRTKEHGMNGAIGMLCAVNQISQILCCNYKTDMWRYHLYHNRYVTVMQSCAISCGSLIVSTLNVQLPCKYGKDAHSEHSRESAYKRGRTGVAKFQIVSRFGQRCESKSKQCRQVSSQHTYICNYPQLMANKEGGALGV